MKKFNFKENKKTIMLTLLAVLTIILVIGGATYAYFQAQGGTASQANVSVKTSTTDSLVFSTGDDINFTADQSTFGKGAGNKAGSSYAKAVLKANDSTNHATANYYVYLDITNNNFEYTTADKTAELILTVIDPDGNEVKSIDGLNYVTVNGISGFDITDNGDLLKIVNNHEIVADGTKEENWNITLTFVNLDSDQSKNAGKNFNAKLEITKDIKKESLAKVCNNKNLNECVIAQFTGTQGENNLYHHDGSIISDNGTILDANDNSYRYAGSSETTNNFVCFGYESTDGTCPTDYLYRIIGVFDNQVKLIKYDYANSNLLGTDGDYVFSDSPDASYYKGSLISIDIYNWNNTRTNVWSASRLNTTNLNTNYLNNIGTKWSNKITTHTWKVGGNTYSNIYSATPPNAYKNEITSPAENTTYDAKVGLMYVSDYGYAAASSAWTTKLSSYSSSSVTSVNWMYMGYFEWTMARYSDDSKRALNVDKDGDLNYTLVYYSDAVRPCFYLNTDVTYVSGEGTISSPILLK